MKKTVNYVVIGICAIALIVIGAMYFTYQNQEVRLAESITAKIEDNKSHYTKMWEVLTNQAGVSKQYAKDFKEIYPALVSGRYSNGQGQMMQWIQEHNPNFDTSLYNKLMVSIEGQRESFHNTQRQLIDLNRQHETLLKTVPSKWFLGNKSSIDIPVVINDASEKAFETEKETPMNLFDK